MPDSPLDTLYVAVFGSPQTEHQREQLLDLGLDADLPEGPWLLYALCTHLSPTDRFLYLLGKDTSDHLAYVPPVGFDAGLTTAYGSGDGDLLSRALVAYRAAHAVELAERVDTIDHAYATAKDNYNRAAATAGIGQLVYAHVAVVHTMVDVPVVPLDPEVHDVPVLTGHVAVTNEMVQPIPVVGAEPLPVVASVTPLRQPIVAVQVEGRWHHFLGEAGSSMARTYHAAVLWVRHEV